MASETKPETKPSDEATAWAETRAFLRQHPDLIREDPELLAELGLWRKAANVIEFGPAALGRLEAAAARESDARKAIEQVAKANFAAQVQTHGAVVDLLESRNHADLARRLDTAARERFGLATAVVALEADGSVPFGWRKLDTGGVDARLGERGLSRLGEWPPDEDLFGERWGIVKSVALARMSPWSNGRPALMAFGAAQPDAFRPDMGAELVAFLARVVERVAERWPVL